MRNMSFMLTKQQIREQTKVVTRRQGWWKLKPGDRVAAVEKAMGLKKGEKVQIIATLRIVSVRAEPLDAMLKDREYGIKECEYEGFGEDATLSDPQAFVSFFCDSHKGCGPTSVVNRIEFEYIDSP